MPQRICANFVDYCRKTVYAIVMENLDLYECRSVVYDKTFRLTAERLVIKSGIRADLKGFRCLVDAVILFGTEMCDGFCEIYRTIGALRELKPKSVMREISYAVNQSYDLHNKLSAMIGTTVCEADIHNGLVIAYLGRLFKNPDLSVYA